MDIHTHTYTSTHIYTHRDRDGWMDDRENICYIRYKLSTYQKPHNPRTITGQSLLLGCLASRFTASLTKRGGDLCSEPHIGSALSFQRGLVVRSGTKLTLDLSSWV